MLRRLDKRLRPYAYAPWLYFDYYAVPKKREENWNREADSVTSGQWQEKSARYNNGYDLQYYILRHI